MKRISLVFYFILFFLAAGFAQNQARLPNPPQKIALFAPLYLDSVFDAGYAYRFGNTFPRFANPGLEFYQGAQMALDSLKRAGAPLEVFVYDTRSTRMSLAQRINSRELADVELMIAHASVPEVKLLAEAAQQKKIPFISATLPNDAGITNNPYFVVLNSTLRTHCEGIYKYVQRYHSLDRIVVFQKNGNQEDQIREYLQESVQTASGVALKIEFRTLSSEFDFSRLASSLDATRNTVCIAGSLDEAFGTRLAQQLASLRNSYPITIVGMPTWDGLSQFTKPEFKDIEVIYSTPFNNDRITTLSSRLASEFENESGSRPSDMFYRGYETTLRFALLLLDTKKDVASNLTRKGNYIFTNFDIQPVFLNKGNMALDYFENKKLYFVKIMNGVKTVM